MVVMRLDRTMTEESPPLEEVAESGTTYKDYLAAVEKYDTLRVELIDGEIYMTPAPVPFHQLFRPIFLVARQICAHTRSRRSDSDIAFGCGVANAEAEIVQPDLVFIRRERTTALIGDKRITGAPDLVVEVLSPSTAHVDRRTKLPIYARYGVTEYWIADPDDRAIEVYILDGPSYRVAGIFVADETVNVGQFAEAGIALSAVFALPTA